jgi:hypothetical protein
VDLADIKHQFLFHAENPAQGELLFNNFCVLIDRITDAALKGVEEAFAAAPLGIVTREQAFEYALAEVRKVLRPLV